MKFIGFWGKGKETGEPVLEYHPPCEEREESMRAEWDDPEIPDEREPEDFSEEEDSYEVLTDPDELENVKKALEDAGIPLASAEVTMIPQNYVDLTDETAIKNLQKTLDLLDEDDDVQAVYHNWNE